VYFIDVQGTLIDDEKNTISGAIEFIDRLNSTNTPYVVITNNTKQNSNEFLEFLNSTGFDISSKNYIDPFALLKNEVTSKKVAGFGTEEFLQVLVDMGYELDFDTPETLIVSIKKDYTNEEYADMIELALKADQIVAMHETSMYSKDGKRYPGVGAIAKMIEFATGKDYSVVGKPSFNFYDKARDLINAKSFEDITIISDDLIGDIIGAKKLGMKSTLVLSGKVKTLDEIKNIPKENQADVVLKNIGEVI
jgi:NagD protein